MNAENYIKQKMLREERRLSSGNVTIVDMKAGATGARVLNVRRGRYETHGSQLNICESEKCWVAV
jgi:hypothetical protein